MTSQASFFGQPNARPVCHRPGAGSLAKKGANPPLPPLLGLRDASDLAVALVALDAIVQIQGTAGTCSVPLTEFYLLPGDRSDLENVLQHGELITDVEIPR